MRYKESEILKDETGTRYRTNVIYPDIPFSEDDIYVITTIGDRYDTLALSYYNDSSLWWIIASSNVSERASLIVQPGIQIRIPHNKALAIEKFNEINSIR